MSHCNSVIRAFLTTQFFIILPNCDGFPRFFYFVQQKILFHTTHLLLVTSLKIKACNITQVKRVHSIVKQPLQFVAQSGPVVKLLNKSNMALAKTTKTIDLVEIN